MSYELINEELKIYSCSISDLTMKQVNNFLKQLDEDSTIGSLTVFYDQEDDRIVLNKDHEMYETYKNIVLGYINQPQDIREQIKNEITYKNFKDIFDLLDKALDYRKWTFINMIIGNQCNSYDLMDELDHIYDRKNPYVSSVNAYFYGVIQGKKAERAKKHHSEVIA